MMKHILVPLDGSKLAEQALPYALLLHERTGTQLTLLRVVPVEMTALALTGHYQDVRELAARLSVEAQEYLKGLKRTFAPEPRSVDSLVVSGDPATCILERVESEADTVVVMTTHGRSGLGRWLLGSVADKVIRLSARPTLVIKVRDDVSQGYPVLPQGFVVPLDGSAQGERATPYAAFLAKSFPGPVLLLHAMPASLLDHARADREWLISAATEQGRNYLESIRERLMAAGVRDVVVRVTPGAPEPSIIEAVGKGGGRWVVMTTHGRAGAARFVLGSVTDRVIRLGAGPVLVIPPAERPEGLRSTAA